MISYTTRSEIKGCRTVNKNSQKIEHFTFSDVRKVGPLAKKFGQNSLYAEDFDD